MCQRVPHDGAPLRAPWCMAGERRPRWRHAARRNAGGMPDRPGRATTSPAAPAICRVAEGAVAAVASRDRLGWNSPREETGAMATGMQAAWQDEAASMPMDTEGEGGGPQICCFKPPPHTHTHTHTPRPTYTKMPAHILPLNTWKRDTLHTYCTQPHILYCTHTNLILLHLIFNRSEAIDIIFNASYIQ